MAFAAVAERLHEVSAAIHERAFCRIALKRARREEQPLPDADEKSPAEEKAELMRLARLCARLERAQISPQVAQVRIADARERGIRKRRKVVRAIGTPAFAHRAREIRERPAPDARLRIGRDVRAVERAEGRFERPAAREGSCALARLGMTADATARSGEILSALGIALRERGAGEQQKKKPRSSGAFGE